MSQSNIHRYLRHGMLPQLRLFEATARLGSLTQAAQELHMAQPTASVQLRKLSESLGVPVFEQIGRRIYLTEAGSRLYETCQELFGALTNLDDSLARMRTLELGRLRLAVSTSGMCFAPRLLAAFATRHPAIETTMQCHNRQTLIRRMAGNEDDLYLFASAPDIEEVVVQELLPNPMVVLARDDHPLARERRIPFARLAQEPLLMREEGSGARSIALRLFESHGASPRIRMELSSNEAIKEAILAGLGVAIMSRYTFGLDPESEHYICLDVQGFPLENHWYFAYPAGKRLTPAARAFLDFVRLEAKMLAKESLSDVPAMTSVRRSAGKVLSVCL